MSWISLLKHVPWTDVIANAPKVVDSAKKLWDTTVGGREGPAAPPAPPFTDLPTEPPPGAPDTPERQALRAMQARTETLEQAVLALREQMQAASQVARELAEQNTQLIARAQAQEERLRQLAYGLLAVGLLALGALGWLAWGG